MKNRKGLYVRVEDFSTIYRLYDTDILTRGITTFVLNSGGWRTNHTKNCMNDNLPDEYYVFQKDFIWYLKTPNEVVDFVDNMVVIYEG